MNSIDKIFYINLDRRTDRKSQIIKEFASVGIPESKYERFPAIECTSMASYGCAISHLSVLKICLQRRYNKIIILEDDFQFLVDPEEPLKRFLDLNIVFSVYLLGYNAIRTTEYNNFLMNPIEVQTCSGYMIAGDYLPKLIAIWEESVKKLLETGNHYKYACDRAWIPLQDKKWFMPKERIGKQRAGFSDLAGKYMDYGL